MSSPIEELGKMIDFQMKNIAGASKGITVELGIINANMSLSVASLGNTIPKGDYMISLHLKAQSLKLETNSVSLSTSTDDEHSHTVNEHKHTITLPSAMRGIQAGDRVIVAWVGTEPVVVDIVVSS